ncbi:hypothetical protein [Mesorhizobium sp. M1143]|uniref:hypothetical protein n=1 Tax=Mesorhizobium sp. M1143 TaxID=2957061 RepID=UPI00333C977E
MSFLGYDQYRAGYFTRPAMPEGAFSLSYKNGLRGILVGIPDEKTTRRYLGFPREVPFYLVDAWSFCRAPRGDEEQHVSKFMMDRNWPGERFEAVCEIDVEGVPVVRGWITSVPKV